MKILLAVDGSKSAMRAVDCLIEHADWYRDKPVVELVTVHLPVPKLPNMGLVVSKRQLDAYYRDEGRAALTKAMKKLDAAGIPFYERILVGPVAETLVAHARERRCDLILVGTRGMSAAANMLMGSTATKVLHLSKIPVMLVK